MKQANEAARSEKKREEAFSSIGVRSFVTVVLLLCIVLAFCGILSYFVPQGSFDRDTDGVIVDGSFALGEVHGIAPWRVLTAPLRVFASSDGLTVIMISIFLLIMSGVFNLIDKTGGIRAVLGKTVRTFRHKRNVVIALALIFFMLFGSFFGMFEELVALLPLVVVFMLSMGLDTLTSVGVCMLGACFGFSAAITNPFSVGLAAELAGVGVWSGAWLRILFFLMIYALVFGFLLLHVKRIEKDPARSLTYAADVEKRKSISSDVYGETPENNRLFRVFAVFFGVQLFLLLLIACVRAISGLAIPILSLSFLIGGVIAGCLVSPRKSDVARHIGQGALAMLPAVLLIALASSVKLVMAESGILDTVMHGVIEFLRDKNKFLCIILIYFLVLFLQIFIGSASAKIMLVMPILLPISQALGLSSNVVILTYCIADGFTDMLFPTNPVLLIGLSMANVSYGKWVKWTWKLQLLIFSLTVLLLLLAVRIGY